MPIASWARSTRLGVRRVRVLALTVVVLAIACSLAATPAVAFQGQDQPSAQDLPRLQQELDQAQQKLSTLDDQVQGAQGNLETISSKLEQDRTERQRLRSELAGLARLEYQRPPLTLVTVLNTPNLSQLLSEVAQAQLVNRKQQDLEAQAAIIQARDATARDQMATQLRQLQQAQQEAAQVAQKALAMRDEARKAQQAAEAQARAAAAAAAAQAQAVANQATSVAGAGSSSGQSIPDIIIAAFQSQGQAAVDWGLRIAKCESGYNPNAVNPSGATGLFQFMPSTFAATPQGRAGASIWDPVAQSQAAAWMYSQGRQGEWECN